jgi:hypothetical protein
MSLWSIVPALPFRTARRAIAARLEVIAWRSIPRRSLSTGIIARRPVEGRAGFTPQLRGETPPLLVARHVEAGTRILVLAARPPLPIAPLAAAALGRPGFLGTRPQAATGEPHHHRVGMLVVELLEGGLELLAQLRSKRRGLSADDDRPVCEAWRHVLTQKPDWVPAV